MKRAILTPAVLPPPALAELKQWLGITVGGEDALLTHLLGAALETCEAFTGSLPLEAQAEETLRACEGWQTLATAPVQAITAVYAVSSDGTRSALLPDAFQADLDASGLGRIRIARQAGSSRFVVRFIAGLAPDWNGLPTTVRHGIVRLAAYLHRNRDAGDDRSSPPASIAALWRPWRRVRLT